VSAWARRAVGEGVNVCPRAGCGAPESAVLSWIAFRDVRLICQFEDLRDYGRDRRWAQWYGRSGPSLKVDNPSADLIKALQDDLMRVGDFHPKFWARKSIKDIFAIDPDFERSEVLELWKADPIDQVQGDTFERPGNAAITTTADEQMSVTSDGRYRSAASRDERAARKKNGWLSISENMALRADRAINAG
jgi:hypothetical protein